MDRPAHVTVPMLCDAESTLSIRPATEAEIVEAAMAPRGWILVDRRICVVRLGLVLAKLAPHHAP